MPCRYVYMDDMLLAIRASPASKAATLSRDSQALVQSVRADLDAAAPKRDTEVRMVPEGSTYHIFPGPVACRLVC